MKNTIKLCLIAMMMFSMSCSNEPITEAINSSQDADSSQDVDVFSKSDKSKSNSHNSKSDVFNALSGEIVGTSTLHRKKDRVTVNFKTTDLTPGYAYTLWWVIWNNPENCGDPFECSDTDFPIAGLVGLEVLYATGLVANKSGRGNFSASLNVDDDSESVNVPFGLPHRGGLESGNTYSAEVHLVLRSHGPAIPELVDEQIGGYFGGCTTFFPAFSDNPDEIPNEVGECGDIEFALHAPVN